MCVCVPILMLNVPSGNGMIMNPLTYKHLLNSRNSSTLKQISKCIGIIFSKFVYMEMIQKRAVRAIFPGMSYDDILTHINLSTLKDRRDYLCKKYFINMQARSHKVNCLLPEKRHFDHDLRRGNMYPLPVTRTNRYKNSLIPWGLYHWQ